MNQVCTPPTPPQEPPSYASVAEVRGALRALGGVDFKKLYLVARIHCRACGIPASHLEPRELLHEAVVRTLDGRKQWRHGVSLSHHLNRAMENIAGHEVPKLRRRVEAGAGRPDEEGEIDDPLDRLRDLRNYERDRDARDAAHEQAEMAFLLFDGDAEALAVLKCRAEGQEKREIQARMNLSDTDYATISKRILRKITPYYDELRSAGR